MIASSDGVIHFVDAEGKKVLFSQELCKRGKHARAFVSLCFKGTHGSSAATVASGHADDEHTLVALTAAGQLFHFAGVDLAGLRDAIDNRDGAGAMRVRAAIRMTQAPAGAQYTDGVRGAASATVRGDPVVLTWGGGAAGLCLWDVAEGTAPTLRHGVSRALRGLDVVQAATTPDGKLLVVLTSDTRLSVSSLLSHISVMCVRACARVCVCVCARVRTRVCVCVCVRMCVCVVNHLRQRVC